MILKIGDLIPIGGGKKWATGTYGPTEQLMYRPTIQIRDLDFTPNIIYAETDFNTAWDYDSGGTVNVEYGMTYISHSSAIKAEFVIYENGFDIILSTGNSNWLDNTAYARWIAIE